jgi:hypothetical protein
MSKSNLLIKFGAGALLLSLVSVVAATPTIQAQEADSNTTLEELEENAPDLIGEEVTVRGLIDEIEPGMSFTINEEGDIFADDEILVINVSGEMFPQMADEGIEMQVTGEVGQFVYADVNSLYDLDLDPDLYVDYEDRPVILATSSALSPSIGDISDNPEDFYSQEVAIEGQVGEIKNDRAFTINEGGIIGTDDLLVINVTGEPIPDQEERVVVTGMIRPFVAADIERDYDVTWDSGVVEELEAEYSQKPALVVDGIYPSAEEEGLLE